MLHEIIFGSVGLVGGAAGATAATWSIAKSKLGTKTDRQKTVLNLASHSLRSHLNNVLGHSQLLSSRSRHYRSEDQHLIDSLLGSSADVNRILLDVLELVDLDAKKIALDRHETLLWDLFREIEASSIRQARKLGRSVEIDFSDSLQAYYHVDPTRIRQCIIALVGQCLTQSGDHTVHIKATIKKVQKVGHVLSVRVHDPSTKIQGYQANAYFDPKAFNLSHKLGRSNAWRLSILLAKSIAKLAGGDLTAKADLNDGLAFHYDLPVKFIRRAERVESALADAAVDVIGEHVPKMPKIDHDPEKIRLLIVDDDSTNLMILEALLRSLGYAQIVSAEDGSVAQTLLASEQFDAVITDIQMPNMTGLEFTQAVRQSVGERAEIPIIAASAATTPSDRQAAHEAGVNAFIAKPILQDELAVILKEQLDLAITNDVRPAA